MIRAEEVCVVARAHGAPLCGTVSVEALPGNREDVERILPGARSLVVVAAPHSRSALASGNNQVAQYDTIHAYEETARAAHAVALSLEAKGFGAVAVPAFIPIDMAPPKRGMRGEVDWRAAGVAAGLGGYGESGLLVTPEFGPAVRLAGVVTTAGIAPAAAAPAQPSPSPCTRCGACVAACPARALSGGGGIDKKRCGDRIFDGGFRTWRAFLLALTAAKTAEEREALTASQRSMDLWQNFMTGNYYSCFACQSACPVGSHPRG